MKMRFTRAFALLLLSVMLSLLLVSCTNLSAAADKLSAAGYTVVRLGEGAEGVYADAADEDVKSTVRATAGPNGEWLTIVKFKEKEKADEFYRLQKDYYKSSYFMTVEKDGKTVIYGWTAAYDLIK